jgi:hypothetical protein
MRRILGAGVALTCIALLSSCALLPVGPGVVGTNLNQSTRQADVEMQQIADAVKDHNAAALKKLFSVRAREKAIGLDTGLTYFLSAFPSGRVTWKLLGGAPGQTDENEFGKQTVVLFANYTVSSQGKTYALYFADYTVNQVEDPQNVGLYALGIVPSSDSGYTSSGAKKPFNVWASQFWSSHIGSGTPGVYAPQK